MADGQHAHGGLRPGRLSEEELAANFSDLHPLYDAHEARVQADRCYFCFDAPCVAACPTEIDVPLFIRQIQAGMPETAARTIWDQNILGGMCARVCPTETLCEEACVRMEAEGEPVEIGRLQRHATDTLMSRGVHPYARAEPTGHRIAVVGAGPAGLACAHRLAMRGHEVVVFEAREKPGGLNEYGIAAYKTPHDFAAREVEWLMQVGGIEMRRGVALGRDVTLGELREEHDAVFLGMGLAGTKAWRVPGDEDACDDAVRFIADLRQAADLRGLPVGRDVVVIGGGMTAVDAAVQSRLLGAEHVTIAYRREPARMPASAKERDWAARNGVRLLGRVVLRAVEGEGEGAVREAVFDRVDEAMEPTGEVVRVPCDQILRAIGQAAEGLPADLGLAGGKLAVEGPGRTSLAGVWAGGDCARGGADLTVTAVAQGRDAAEDIHAALTGPAKE